MLNASIARPSGAAASRALLILPCGVGLVHLGILLLIPKPILSSNILQELAAALTVWACLHKRNQSVESLKRKLWLQLAAAFSLWTIAESIFCLNLVTSSLPQSPSPSDVVWLAFAFPLLLVVSTTRRAAGRDFVTWMDMAQAGSFFTILFALVFRSPASISMETAYNVQSLAIIFTCALRCSLVGGGPEGIFFRNLFIYSILNGGFSAIGYASTRYGQGPGTLNDLCWSTPLLVFATLTMFSEPAEPEVKPAARFALNHMQGISALGLAVMSMTAAAFLAHHHPEIGSTPLAITFLLFAMRTTAREWQLRSAQERLQYSALHDSLTGFPNRSMLHQELSKRLLAAPETSRKHSAVLFVDLDRFKVINDVLGHAFGDRLLVAVAERCRAAVRPEDIVARNGGDEFVILLNEAEAETAAAVTTRVLEAIRQPLTLDGRVLHLTASVGLAMGSSGTNADEMLRDADCAMYKAKSLGKDRTEAFAPAMRVAANRKLRLETELRKALAAQELQAYYQPIYGLVDNVIVGFEALARWTHPELGSISPGEFVSVAEDMGLIIPLGRMILKDACLRLQAWNLRFGSELTVNVNVSGRQFDDPNLVSGVAAILQETGLPARLLKLEITESVMLIGSQHVEIALAQFRAMGIQICLDDFGTGYSSLGYLLRFPFDVVKIDQSFVKDLHRDQTRTELVRTVVQLAASLGMKVVAEGVECSEEMERLRELQCHMVQGFFLSRPLSPERIESLLARELGTWTRRYPTPSLPALALPGVATVSPLLAGEAFVRQRNAGIHNRA